MDVDSTRLSSNSRAHMQCKERSPRCKDRESEDAARIKDNLGKGGRRLSQGELAGPPSHVGDREPRRVMPLDNGQAG
jgi:hypothetical protein